MKFTPTHLIAVSKLLVLLLCISSHSYVVVLLEVWGYYTDLLMSSTSYQQLALKHSNTWKLSQLQHP